MQCSAAHDRPTHIVPDSSPRSSHRPSEQSLGIAIVPSPAGGCLDAFTWIAHDGVMANAQTANVVLLGVYAAMGQGERALVHIPPIVAFILGVFVACSLRAGADAADTRKLGLICLGIEIVVLVVVMVLHARVPAVAGTVGISFAAALQTASFAKVQGGGYSSVMVTGNLRSSVELLSIGWIEKRYYSALRQVRNLVTVCVAFTIGAGVGAFATGSFSSGALAVPIVLLLVALCRCMWT